MEELGYVSNWYDIPGMDFHKSGLTGLGVIVKTTEQADLVVSDVLTLIDSGQVSIDTFGFILVSDLLPTTDKLMDPNCITSAISSAMIDLSPYFSLSVEKCSEYDYLFTELVKVASYDIDMNTYDGEFGGCWLWLHDNTSELTRALLNTKRVFVSTDGRYLANLPEFSNLIDLRKREDMVSTLSKLVNNKFGTSSCFFSVLNSDNPSDIPFYVDNMINDNIPFFNCSWNY